MLTTIVTHATGDLLPAADWNTYVRDNVNWLITAGANIGGSGTLIPTNEFHIVTGTTTLDTIAPVSPVQGQRIRLLFQSVVQIRNNGGGFGNILFVDRSDHITKPNEIVTFTYDGSYWWGQGASAGGFSSHFDVVNNAAGVVIFAQSIPGGLLGPNGALRILIEGDYLNNSGAARNLFIQIAYGGTTLWGTSMGVVAGAGHRAFYLDALLSNEAATNSQRLAGRASLSDGLAGTAAGIGDSSPDLFNYSFGGSAAVDSTVDQSLTIYVQHSAAAATIEFQGTVHVTYQP